MKYWMSFFGIRCNIFVGSCFGSSTKLHIPMTDQLSDILVLWSCSLVAMERYVDSSASSSLEVATRGDLSRGWATVVRIVEERRTWERKRAGMDKLDRLIILDVMVRQCLQCKNTWRDIWGISHEARSLRRICWRLLVDVQIVASFFASMLNIVALPVGPDHRVLNFVLPVQSICFILLRFPRCCWCCCRRYRCRKLSFRGWSHKSSEVMFLILMAYVSEAPARVRHNTARPPFPTRDCKTHHFWQGLWALRGQIWCCVCLAARLYVEYFAPVLFIPTEWQSPNDNSTARYRVSSTITIIKLLCSISFNVT